MKNYSFLKPLVALVLILCSFDTFGQTTTYEGVYTGKVLWNSDTVKITGDFTADSLYISAGTFIQFQVNRAITINNYLEATGTFSDSIIFTVKDPTGFDNPATLFGGWGGIILNHPAGAILSYCRLEYVKNTGAYPLYGAINAVNDNTMLTLSHCVLRNVYNFGVFGFHTQQLKIDSCDVSMVKGTGIRAEASFSQISGCKILNNTSNGIWVNEGVLKLNHSTLRSNKTGLLGVDLEQGCYISNNVITLNAENGVQIAIPIEDQQGYIMNNVVSSNGFSGLNLYAVTLPVVGNLIYGNNRKGIDLVFSSPKFINNTIVENHEEGIHSSGQSIKIYNSIIRNNNNSGSQLTNDVNQAFFTGVISYSDIQGFTGDMIDGDFIQNKAVEPFFIDTLNENFRLTDSSECINAGNPDTSGMYLPTVDPDGNPRIFDQIVDMGAYENQHLEIEILDHQQSLTLCEGTPLELIIRARGKITGYQWQKNGTDVEGADTATYAIDTLSISDTGTYNCLVFSIHDTISSHASHLTVFLNPVLDLGKDTTIYKNEVLLLDAGAFSNYLWNDGSTEQTISFTSQDVGSYILSVKVTDNNGCLSGDSIIVAVMQAPTGISLPDLNLKIYPNPSSDLLLIESGAAYAGITQLILWDSKGSMVYSKKPATGILSETIQLSRFEKGFYFLEIRFPKGSVIRKILVE